MSVVPYISQLCHYKLAAPVATSVPQDDVSATLIMYCSQSVRCVSTHASIPFLLLPAALSHQALAHSVHRCSRCAQSIVGQLILSCWLVAVCGGWFLPCRLLRPCIT